MITSGQIEIPLSKGKLILAFIGSIVFVALGIWLSLSPPQFENGFFSQPAFIVASGIAAILFFGLCAFLILKKLRDNRAGLVIDKTGITDNASGISAGHIPWTDITEIKMARVLNQKFVMVIVRNPDEYINRQGNKLKRKAAEFNFKSYGSPISISANSLKYDFEELQKVLLKQFNKYRK
jgi:hypothetical protein